MEHNSELCLICGQPSVFKKYPRPGRFTGLCLKHSKTNTLEVFKIRYGEDDALLKWEQYLQKIAYSQSLEYYVEKYGEIEGSKKWEIIKIKKHKALEPYFSNNDSQRKNLILARESLEKTPHKRTAKIEYWLAKGFSPEEARQKLSERQTTFTLEKCIKKYGEEEGRKIYKDRQIKWQETLKKDPIKYEEIQRKKFKDMGYSKASQEVFNLICERLEHEHLHFNEVFYATRNKEFYVAHPDGYGSLLDFYIKDINFCVEYDGEYYHRNTSEKDRMRDQKIELSIKGIKIFHINETEYYVKPKEIIDAIIQQIKSMV